MRSSIRTWVFIVLLVLPIGLLGAAPPPAGGSSVPDALPPEEQRRLAERLFDDMSAMEVWDLDGFIAAYTEVAAKCPDTHLAEEALWRLSNIYLIARDTTDGEPDLPQLIAVLEKLLQRYPTSDLAEDARNRVLMAYEMSGDWRKAADLYAGILKDPQDRPAQELLAIKLGYAESLAGLGDTAGAGRLFEEILQADPDRNGLEAQLAAQRLGRN